MANTTSGTTTFEKGFSISDIVEEAYERATKIIKKKMKDLHKLAEGLLEHELLSGDEIKDLLAGKKIKRDEDTPATGPSMSVPKAGGA